MKGLRNVLVALVLGISAPALIWVGAGAALWQSRKKAMACSMDTDCPPNYVCAGGRCVPAKSG